jgi:hypothetical protein
VCWLDAHSTRSLGGFLAKQFVQLSHYKGKGWGSFGI